MKNLLIVLIICSFFSILFSQTVMIDRLVYNFNVAVNTPDSSNTGNYNNASILSGQVDFFVYQYPLQPGSDATANAQVILQTSAPSLPRIYGRTSFSVDAAIYGYGISTYDGIDSVTLNGHPCGNQLVHLDNEIACANPVVASPGLQLDLSKKDLFAIEILSLDIGNGNNLIIRVWDNSGNTGCVSYMHPSPVIPPSNSNAQIAYKPLVIFPFSSFTKGNLIDWSNIRAISIEYNSTIASVDLIVGPLEALGWGAVKNTTTSQPISPNSAVAFEIDFDFDQYNTNFLAQLLTNIAYDVTITDTLPAEFNNFSTNPFTVTDQFNNLIPVNSLSVNAKTATFQFSINNTQDPKISYTTRTTTPYNFCSKTVCNNAVMTVVTRLGNTTTSKQVTRNTCVDLKSTPLLTTTFQTCPNVFNNIVETVSRVCNNGNGLATSVNFVSTASNSLSQCTPIFPSGICDGTTCTRNLGDIVANGCVDVSISYNCSTFEKTCIPQIFTSSFSATENCSSSSSTSQNCSFSLNPGTPNVQITNTCPANISPSNQTTQLVSQVCNNGTGIARNVVFTHTSQLALVNCTSTINQGTCSGTTCTSNLGDLEVDRCVTLVIGYSCSSYEKTCTTVNFPSTVSAVEGCNTTVTPQSCSFNLNPGTPLITTEYQSCPTFDSNLQTNIISQVCNKGNGIARNVVFTETPNESLVNCVASLSNQVCVGGVCTINLGDFEPGFCRNLTTNYNCSIYSTECIIKRFSASSNVQETCGTLDSKNTCVFRTTPSINITVTEVVVNTAPARINEVVTWNIRVNNRGPQTAKSFILQKTYPQYTFPTTSTLSSWTCDSNRVCLFNGSSLTNGETKPNIPFSVTILSDIPIGTQEVCNTLVVMSQPNEPNCYSEATTQMCAPVNPGTPDLVVKKRVFTSQYTFKVGYKNVGTGPVNNLVLIDNLQDGWTLSSSSAVAGWSCVGTKCTQTIPNVPSTPGQNSGVSTFVVDVDPLFQTYSNGSSKCWSNFVNSTFDDVKFDPTPQNNYASTGLIGSSCQKCCKQESCPVQDCTLTCPPTNLIVNCPPVTCKCEVPEFWCPTCQTKPPACDCNQCLTTGIQFA